MSIAKFGEELMRINGNAKKYKFYISLKVVMLLVNNFPKGYDAT